MRTVAIIYLIFAGYLQNVYLQVQFKYFLERGYRGDPGGPARTSWAPNQFFSNKPFNFTPGLETFYDRVWVRLKNSLLVVNKKRRKGTPY